MSAAGFRELCLACRRGLEEGEEGVYEPPLGLLETVTHVFPERALGQEAQLAEVFLAAAVRRAETWKEAAKRKRSTGEHFIAAPPPTPHPPPRFSKVAEKQTLGCAGIVPRRGECGVSGGTRHDVCFACKLLFCKNLIPPTPTLFFEQGNGHQEEMVRVLGVIAACRRPAEADGAGAGGGGGGGGGEGAGVSGDGDGDGDGLEEEDLPEGFLEV